MEDAVGREPVCDPGYGLEDASFSLKSDSTALISAAALRLVAGCM